MPMSSNEIAAMLSQQNSMFSGFANYAQQITPPMGAAPGMGMGAMPQAYSGHGPLGFNQGPASVGMPMPVTSSWHPGMMGGMAMPFGPPSAGGAQAMSESMLGSGFAAASSGMQGLGALSGVAGLGAGALGMAGMGTSTLAMGLGAMGSLPVTAALGAGSHIASNMYQGFQQRQGVNQVLRSRFGNIQGIGSGQGGMGFSTGEMGGISTMMREMGTEDLTTNMEELTRVMNKTAGMGLYRGVQSAREFRQKFQSTVDSLKEISEIMHTTLEGATSFMSQAKGMGFFSGKDISQQLAMTRVMSSATGLSIDQTSSMAQQGAQMARAMGGRGRHGAQAGLISGGRIAMAQSMGILSDEDMAFATGGLTGAEGAQALSGRLMQTSQRFMSRGDGRAMVAGLWDADSGGINQERLNAAMSGGMNFRDLLRQGRQNISATGGRRSEFFRDEEQLRSQVLAQGGEYLPMAMYGTRLAERRGLSSNDPIVQRAMRRRFKMSQGEVEAATEMMRNMPQIQAEFITKGRRVREQETRGAGKESRGLVGLGKRLGRLWEREVENPFRQTADNMITDVSKGIEDMVSTMEGRVTAQMSEASKQLIMERSEFGQAVSKSATRASRFGAEEYKKFMATAGSASYSRGENMERAIGAMLGMRPDTDGMGRRIYEAGFDAAGEDIASIAGGLGTAENWLVAGATILGIGTAGTASNFRKDVYDFAGGGAASITSGSDVAFGLRSLAKDTGIEGLFNEVSGYDPRTMTRRERGAALGFKGGTDEELRGFLSQATSEMKRDLGYNRKAQKRMGQEYADIMYSRLADGKVRDAWRKTYQRGFGGVNNVLQHAEYLGSPELRAAAQKARKGTKAEQVAFVRMLEEEGGVVEDLTVTGELSKELSGFSENYEKDIEGIRSRRAAAFGELEEATTTYREASSFSKGAGEVLARTWAGVTLGLGEALGLTGAIQDIAGQKVVDTEGITETEMNKFLSDEVTRDAYILSQTGSREKKNEAIRQLEGLAATDMDEGRANTFRRLQSIKSDRGKKAMLTIAQSFDAESYRASIEVESDMGKQLRGAMKGASIAGMGSEGRAAWEKLQRVADLRSSMDPEDIDKSYALEHDLMRSITGTQAGKDVRRALQGREGGEYVLAGLEGSESYFSRFGGGKRRMGHRAKVSNIMEAMLGTGGMRLSDSGVREALGVKSEREVLNMLAKGGEQSQEAIQKILSHAGKTMSGTQLSTFRKRLEETGSALQDTKITEEEARRLSGGLGGRLAGQARARADAEKTATADGQKLSNKHLSRIAAATQIIAQKDTAENSITEAIGSLAKSINTGKTRPE